MLYLSVSLQKYFDYVRTMLERLQEGVSKVIKYVSTPLHALTAIVLSLLAVIWFAPLPAVSQNIFVGLVCFVVVVIVLLIVFSHKKLQFTAEEQITWQRERLGDSTIQQTYVVGQIMGQKKPEEITGNKAGDSK